MFDGCTGLKTAIIPKSVKKMENSTFVGCDNLTIVTERSSYAEAYAKGNLIKVKYINEDMASAPELLRKTACTVTLKHIDGYEYRLNDGEWQSSNVFTGLNPNTEYKFYRRTAAADESPAGAASYALTVVTSDIIKGDINDDREVNILDFICLKKFFADPLNNVVPSECLDISDDGRINSEDLAALRENLLLK